MANDLPDWAKRSKDVQPLAAGGDPDLPDWARRAKAAQPPPPPAEMIGGEPTFGEEFISGLTATGRGIAQFLPERAAQPPPPEAVTATKVPRQQPSPFSAGALLGNVADPLNYIPGVGLAKFVPRATPLVRSLITGGVAGLTQPVEEPEKDFAAKKIAQTEAGLMMGYGFSIAGKGVSKGLDAIGSYMVRQYPEMLENLAVQKVLKRISQDEKAGGLSAKNMIDLIDAANTEGKPLTLADVGGKNVRGLAGTIYRGGGEAGGRADVLFKQRDNEAAQRLNADVNKYLHGGPTAFQATDALIKSRSAAARPLYEATDNLEHIWSPRLQNFLDDPDVRKGLSRGYVLERREALAENRPFDPYALGVDVDVDGNVKLIRVPNMRTLDMAKKGLDAMVADTRDEITGRLSQDGVALNKLRNAYLRELDSLDTSGTYAKARASWGGYSASLDALRMGRTSFSRSGEENAREFAALSENDKEFWRMGLADNIKEKLAKTGFTGDEAKSIVKNPWMIEQMRPAFRTQKDLDAFVDAVMIENKMFQARRSITGGSQTAERFVEDAGDPTILAAAKLGQSMLGGGWLHRVSEMYRFSRDVIAPPDPKLNEAISKILFSPLSPQSQAARSILAPPSAVVAPTAPAARAVQDIGAPLAAGVSGEMVRRFDSSGNPISSAEAKQAPVLSQLPESAARVERERKRREVEVE